MANQSNVQKPISEQIYDELFLRLKKEGFDTASIESLRQLAQGGELTKATEVINIINLKPENLNETP